MINDYYAASLDPLAPLSPQASDYVEQLQRRLLNHRRIHLDQRGTMSLRPIWERKLGMQRAFMPLDLLEDYTTMLQHWMDTKAVDEMTENDNSDMAYLLALAHLHNIRPSFDTRAPTLPSVWFEGAPLRTTLLHLMVYWVQHNPNILLILDDIPDGVIREGVQLRLSQMPEDNLMDWVMAVKGIGSTNVPIQQDIVHGEPPAAGPLKDNVRYALPSPYDSYASKTRLWEARKTRYERISHQQEIFFIRFRRYTDSMDFDEEMLPLQPPTPSAWEMIRSVLQRKEAPDGSQ